MSTISPPVRCQWPRCKCGKECRQSADIAAIRNHPAKALVNRQFERARHISKIVFSEKGTQ